MPKFKKPPAEGDRYGVFAVGGNIFDVRYGYACESDRRTERSPGLNLIPIFPDFVQAPLYDENGALLATDIQNPCEHYAPENPEAPEDWCRDCRYYPEEKPQIGICRCEKRKKQEEPK